MGLVKMALVESTSATSTTLVLPLLILTFVFWKLIQRAYSTDLTSIPGPWHAKFTSLPLKLRIIRGRRAQYIHYLHEIYGPVVRIGPEEVDVSDLQGYHAIHKIGNGFRKSQWYPRFRTAFTDQDVFSETDSKSHSSRRKILSRPFSKSNLRQNWEWLVRDRAQLATQKIKAQAESGVCDVYQWWTFYTVDAIGQIAFGESFSMLELGRKTDFIRVFENVGLTGILRAEFPFIYRLIQLMPKFIFDINLNEKKIIQYGKTLIDRIQQGSIDRSNIFTGFVLNEKSESDKCDFRRDTVVTEATGLVGAGGGTTAVTLTYLVWAVLSNPRIQKKIEAEVATLSSEFTDAELENLPYLNAVIEESLRAYGAIPGALSRIVPEAGLHTCGHFIPQGTTVCTQSYTMHRKSEIFTNPESYDPERFLQEEYTMPEQRSAFAAFGDGARTCLGMHLAYMELRIAATLFFRDCAGARLALSSTDDMDMVNFFGGGPKGQSCNITLTTI